MTPIGGVAAPVSVRRTITNLPGNYLQYYANLRDHLRGQADLLISPAQVQAVMQVLDLGRRSARDARWMVLAQDA